ncbi:MAG: ytcC [Proteiniphilum sp.]|jgi:glycosyltransferase involved in cell wall biosynthesis|nr:ytcC [Proteiniphilum sp.]
MRVAVLTSGLLPVPALQGGAVENLVDLYLEFNEQKKTHHITVFSVIDKKVPQNLIKNSLYTQYVFFRSDRLSYKLKRKLFGFLKKKTFYYHYHIEYYLYKALRKLKNKKYDVIILENRPGYAMKVYHMCPGSRLVLHLHNDLLSIESNEASSVKSYLSSVITVSDYIKIKVAEVEPYRPVNTCYNGIDLSLFETNISRSNTRNELNIRQNEFVVVYSGRLIPEKGVRELLQAMQYLDDLPFKLLIIGGDFFGGNVAVTDYMKDLYKIASAHKDRIIFTGFVPYDKIPGYLQCADACVIPSLWEDPCPLSCIEGMAAGLPMVVTLSGGMPELVDDRCAFVLEKSSNLPFNIAKAIRYLFFHPEKRMEMSEAAKKRSLQFSKERYANNFFELMGQ